jgi:polyhydroxyalkanoate synthesis regulator protein
MKYCGCEASDRLLYALFVIHSLNDSLANKFRSKMLEKSLENSNEKQTRYRNDLKTLSPERRLKENLKISLDFSSFSQSIFTIT